MTHKWMAGVSAAALIAGVLYVAPGSAQNVIADTFNSFFGASEAHAAAAADLFTTDEFRNDRALWTDPTYYRNNTWGQLRGQAFNFDSGGEGSGQIASSRAYGTEGTADLVSNELFASPYAFTTAEEHYESWLEEADGGTQHTNDTIPDWSGRWMGGVGLGVRGYSPADVIPLIQADYQEAIILELRSIIEGRLWGAGTFCLPSGFFNTLSPTEWMVTPDRTWNLGESNTGNTIRWIYTNGEGHTPENFAYPKWYGESIGFWDGDSLIVHTNQVKGWAGGVYEYSDQLEAVERYTRVGDVIEAEITVYDPEVFTRPLHNTGRFTLDPETNIALNRMLFNSCTDTNGPSNKVHMDERGLNNERLPGDPLYFNAADPRPWITYLEEGEQRYNAYLSGGGTPSHLMNTDPTGSQVIDRTGN